MRNLVAFSFAAAIACGCASRPEDPMTEIDPGTVVWADLQTPDLEKSKKFYGDLLGWKFVADGDASSYVRAQVDGRTVAGLAQKSAASPLRTAWTAYFATADADAFAKAATAAGAKVVVAPTDVADAGRAAHFSDPSGAHFAVWQPKERTGADVFGETGSMVWHEVYTQDPESTRAFYAGVMKLDPKKVEFTEAGFTGLDYWTMHRGGKTVGGVGPKLPEGEQPRWHTYFAVDDIEAKAKRIPELGGQMLMAPFKTPYGTMVMATDPEGAIFALITPTKEWGKW